VLQSIAVARYPHLFERRSFSGVVYLIFLATMPGAELERAVPVGDGPQHLAGDLAAPGPQAGMRAINQAVAALVDHPEPAGVG
jgi:hypothetical protein